MYKCSSNNMLLRANFLVHLFALAHALVVITFKHFNIPDEIPLTILTTLMIVMVARLNKFPYDLSAVLALLLCFGGFFIGSKGGEWLTTQYTGFLQEHANVIMTIFVTELVGWTTYWIVRSIQPSTDNTEET